MSFRLFVFASAFLLNGILAVPATTYDQQQNGDLNVRVDLKDIEVVALLNSDLLGDFGDYDYAYDYSDFTLKPITAHATSQAASTGQTSAPITTTVKPWNSWPTVAPSGEKKNLTKILASDLPAAEQTAEEETSTEAGKKTDVTNDSPERNADDFTASSTAAEIPVTESQIRLLRRCNPGLARDQKGRCRLHIRRRIAATSSLLPYGIRLNQQIHRTKEHDEDN